MQLKDSEYPQNIYDSMLEELVPMEGNTLNVMRKKLKLLEGIVINRSFCNNRVDLPNVFERNGEKQIVIDHIIAISNMARVMKPEELTRTVEELEKPESQPLSNVFLMISLLLAAGNRPLSWRESLLNHILKWKKMKLVKEFVSYWWKGRSPETEEEQRLYMLVRSVENPYSYFA